MSKKININKYINLYQYDNTKEADMHIAGDIVDMEWWEDDVTPSKILDELNKLGEIENLNLFINSYGGSVCAGDFIINLLDEYRRKTNVKIHSKIANAYSMASGIAMVGDTVSIYANGTFMIHKPLSSTWGNADDMRKEAEVLDVFETAIVKNYLRHFKGNVEGASPEQVETQLRELIDAETWFSAEQALEYGFVDEIIEPIQMVASGKNIKVDNVLFKTKEIVNILSKKIENQKPKKEENNMKYNEILLEKYGISEETFNTFTDVSNFMEIINAKLNAEIKNAIEQGKQEALNSVKEGTLIVEDFISIVDVAEKLDVEKISETELIDFAQKGKNMDPEYDTKISKFDKLSKEHELMKKSAIENAIKAGIRAMGAENFSEDVWKNTLETMSYENLCIVTTGWENKAMQDLNAGNRVSQPTQKTYNVSKLQKNENYNV